MTAKKNPRRKDIHSLALVDFGYIFTRNYRGAGVNAPPNAAAERTLREMQEIADDVDHVIICLDWPPYRRRERFAEYKAQREERPPEELGQRKAILKELERRGFRLASARGYEADDIIATLCAAHVAWCPDIRIIGPDKDMGQLICTNVVQWVPESGKRAAEKRDRQRYREKLGAWPEQMILWQALVGDSDDNVPGVKDIGPKKATLLVDELLRANAPYTPEALKRHIEEAQTSNNIHGAVMIGYDSLVLSYDLVRLETDAPIDAEGLLDTRAPIHQESTFMPSQTPPDDDDAELTFPEASDDEDPFAVAPPVAPAAPVAERNADRAAREQQERERELERQQQERQKVQQEARRRVVDEASPVGKAMMDSADRAVARQVAAQDPAPANERIPELGKPAPPVVDKPKPAPVVGGLVKVSKGELVQSGWGLTTTDLEPMNLDAAWNLAKSFAKGGLYRKTFASAEEILTIIHRGREMGLPLHVALSGFHMIEGKPSVSADLIRALAERDPNCKYFYLVESSATHATWETWHKNHPAPRRRTYSMEQAEKVPQLWRAGKGGGRSNWEIIPEEMFIKTAGSKLAREVYPGACMGLYCPEELGNGYIETVGEAA